MVKLVEVSEEEAMSISSRGHRGRISYPILKSFMESNLRFSRLDREGLSQSALALTATLGAYAKTKGLPVRVSHRNGEVYLMRSDMDKEGNILPPEKVTEIARSMEPTRLLTIDVVRSISPTEGGFSTSGPSAAEKPTRRK